MKNRTLLAMDALAELLSRGDFDIHDEKLTQEQIGAFLSECGAVFEREKKVEHGIIDFFFTNSGVALEVKANKKWQKMEVYRQCERYCKDPQVNGLILATGHFQGLPESIGGKPARVFSLGLTSL